MGDSRKQILDRLRAAPDPFPDLQPPSAYAPVALVADTTPQALTERFVHEAERLSCVVHRAADDEAARSLLPGLLEEGDVVSCWDDAALPLSGILGFLREAGITVTTPGDPQATVGITGADAGLAATGSLILMSGEGRYRLPSLLPPRHIAVVRASQILPHLEAWMARQRRQGLDAFQASSNIIIISGPSRTADIAMELVLGMHGPGALHIILIAGP